MNKERQFSLFEPNYLLISGDLILSESKRLSSNRKKKQISNDF